MNKTRQAIIISFAEKYGVFLINFINSIVIARLLTPSEVGIFSIASVMIGFIYIVQDFGATQYIIKENELDHEKQAAAFTTILIIGWALAGITYILSGYAAAFYEEPIIESIFHVLAINFIIIPFGAIILSYLRRNLAYATIIKITLLSSTVNSVTAITFAFNGAGPISLAYASLAGTFTTVVVSLILKPKELSLRIGLKGIWKVLSFGTLVSGNSIVNQINYDAPELIIGKLIDMEAVGLFSKAQGVLRIFNRIFVSAISSFVLPIFSMHIREGKDVCKSYLVSVEYLTVASWPFFVFVGLNAHEIVLVLFGDQWIESAPVVQVLCIGRIAFSMFSLSYHLFIATGQIKQYLLLNTIMVFVRVVLVLAAAPFGLLGIAYMIALSHIINTVAFYRLLNKSTGIKLRQVLLHCRNSFYVTLTVLFFSLSTILATEDVNDLIYLLVCSITTLTGWLIGVFVFNHKIKNDITDFMKYAGNFIQREAK